MLDITDKTDNTPGSAGELTAAEFNDHKNELQAGIENSGQTLAIGKTPLQHPMALFLNGTAAQTFVDNGTVNAIGLTPLSGSNGFVVSESYALLDGAIIEFNKTAANTSTTVTVDIGQTTGTYLGVKSLKTLAGGDPSIGSIDGWTRIKWDNGNDYWVLLFSEGSYFKISNNLSEGVAATMRTNLGVVAKTAGGSDPFTGALYIQATTALLDMYDTDGTTGYRRYRLQNTGSGFKIQQQDDAGTPVLDIFKWDNTDKIVFGDHVSIHREYSYFQLYDTGGTANKRKARLYQGGDIFGIFLRNDDDSANKVLLKYDWTNEAGIETLAGYRDSSGTESEVLIKEKIIEIGDWNMDTTDYVAVVHGLTFTAIRSISAIIRKDDNSTYVNFFAHNNTEADHIQYLWASSTSVTLRRAIGGIFDSVDYNSTSFNRGWIFLSYIA